MRIHIRWRDVPEDAQERAAIDEALRHALDPQSSRLLSISAAFEPSPPMHGTERYQCQLRARLRDGRCLTSDDHARVPAEAARLAAARIAQRLELTRRLVPAQRLGVFARRSLARTGGNS